MKRLFATILSLCLILTGCAAPAPAPEPVPEVRPEAETPAPEAASFERLALRLAELPSIPAEPDEEAFYESLNGLSDEEQAKRWDDFAARQSAYHDALSALRGEGVDPALTPAFAAYTLRAARELMAEETEKNVVWSPANLYLALCMLSQTAGGESRAQLLDLLGLSDAEQARSAANALWRGLYRDGETGKTLLANSLWLNERFDYREDTVDTLSKDCFASVFRGPMGEKSTDQAIADWINENTNHLLEDAAGGVETDPDTLLMLISALYFKGTWASQFEAFDTKEDVFTNAKGEEQTAQFMHRTQSRGTCYAGKGFTAASLPFRDGASMWFLLPDEGIPLQSLLPTADNLNIAIDAPEGQVQNTAFGPFSVQESMAEIHWSVPKFDVDSDLDLIPALQKLGVTDVFSDDAADFSPLTSLDAVVSAVKHAARVKVNEEGCEAAAFTAVMAEATSALMDPLPVVEMDLNRPFGFLITGADGLPLFLGAVNTLG